MDHALLPLIQQEQIVPIFPLLQKVTTIEQNTILALLIGLVVIIFCHVTVTTS